MKFAEAWWLLGSALALVVGALYVWGGLKVIAATKAFGEPALVTRLLTARAGGRRATKSALVVLSVALAFVALAGPQYGRGTRLIPATNLDCVIVLDYSKSMYAQDVAPNRTDRAKAEVARLIASLPGARFGAVAFAGEPLSFPLTSDGGAIAQFFRQTTPNDMPIGGTAIARALEAARELLQRDPISHKHQKVIVLVTDGEDLEGNPVDVAKAAAKDGVLLHVVQIGSRAPETIPEVDELGRIKGVRRDARGQPLTTTLSAAGEAQLAEIAQATSGKVVRAETGQTGIDEITRELEMLMTEELAERVETVYADVFYYPLGLALLLLVIEVFVPLSRRRVAAALLAASSLFGCKQQEQELFTRHSPVVDRAISAIDTLDAGTAGGLLSEYLSTGKCKDGNLGTPDKIRDLPNATVDLALSLFQVAERYGGKFGEPPGNEQDPNASHLLSKRSQHVDCALRLVRVIAADPDVPLELRAQAHYLSGNLELLRFNYRAAVEAYDQALLLYPGGSGDAGTELGTLAAFNRAIALARALEDEKEKEPPPDAGTPPPSDGGEPSDQGEQEQEDAEERDDQQRDPQQDQQQDQQQQDQQQQDQQQQDQQQQDQQQQDQQQQDQQRGEGQEQAASPARQGPSLSQDERMLDELERAPMFQHVQQGPPGQVRLRMEDK